MGGSGAASGAVGGLLCAAPQAESIEVTVLETTAKGTTGSRLSGTAGSS